jgi:hypothetical protein
MFPQGSYLEDYYIVVCDVAQSSKRAPTNSKKETSPILS